MPGLWIGLPSRRHSKGLKPARAGLVRQVIEYQLGLYVIVSRYHISHSFQPSISPSISLEAIPVTCLGVDSGDCIINISGLVSSIRYLLASKSTL